MEELNILITDTELEVEKLCVSIDNPYDLGKSVEERYSVMLEKIQQWQKKSFILCELLTLRDAVESNRQSSASVDVDIFTLLQKTAGGPAWKRDEAFLSILDKAMPAVYERYADQKQAFIFKGEFIYR